MSYILEALKRSQVERELGQVPRLERAPYLSGGRHPGSSRWVVAAFALTGRVLDVTALIGAIMLVGIAVNNGIVLVDAANQLRDRRIDVGQFH